MVAEFIAVHLARVVISQVVQKLGDLLANEAKSLSSVRDDVEYLKRELKFMNGFLKDADRRQKQEELVRDWIAEVRDVACEIAEEGTSSLRNLRKSYPEEEEDVVSMKDVARTLKAQLLKEEEELRIVSIVGMGGLGKTTLANKVYLTCQLGSVYLNSML